MSADNRRTESMEMPSPSAFGTPVTSHDVHTLRAERHANAYFVRPFRDCICDDAMDAKRRQQQCDDGERAAAG